MLASLFQYFAPEGLISFRIELSGMRFVEKSSRQVIDCWTCLNKKRVSKTLFLFKCLGISGKRPPFADCDTASLDQVFRRDRRLGRNHHQCAEKLHQTHPKESVTSPRTAQVVVSKGRLSSLISD